MRARIPNLASVARALGFVLVAISNSSRRLAKVYRTSYFLPYVVGTAAASLMWFINYDTVVGVYNELLLRIGIIHEPLAFLASVQPQVWGAEVFKLGLWVSLPVVSMLMLVNLVMGLVARVAPQMNIFSVGFPVTLGVGLTGLWLTLPMMQAPLTMALERMMGYFQ